MALGRSSTPCVGAKTAMQPVASLGVPTLLGAEEQTEAGKGGVVGAIAGIGT